MFSSNFLLTIYFTFSTVYISRKRLKMWRGESYSLNKIYFFEVLPWSSWFSILTIFLFSWNDRKLEHLHQKTKKKKIPNFRRPKDKYNWNFCLDACLSFSCSLSFGWCHYKFCFIKKFSRGWRNGGCILSFGDKFRRTVSNILSQQVSF